MNYTNSSLVSYTKLSPNHSGIRNHVIDTVSIHCVVGQLSVESIGRIFANASREASCNYAIGSDGRIALIVEEKNRSWCTSSSSNDHRAVTIECASDLNSPYAVNDAVYNSLIKLLADICKRNNIDRLLWQADKSLIGQVDKQNMTVHRWFKNKSCPGDYLYNRHGEIASAVNGILHPVTDGSVNYLRVQVGAFSNKDNADAQEAKVRAAGFDTYMVKVNGLYKIQVGAYAVKENADNMLAKVKAAGFSDAFITTECGEPVNSTSSSNSTVTPAPSPSPAPSKTARQVAEEIYKGIGDWGVGENRKQKVEAAGLNYQEVQSYVNELMGYKSSSTAPSKIVVGSNVKLRSGAKTYDGKSLANFVYTRVHKVSQINGDRAVIAYNGAVVAAVKVSDLTIA